MVGVTSGYLPRQLACLQGGLRAVLFVLRSYLHDSLYNVPTVDVWRMVMATDTRLSVRLIGSGVQHGHIELRRLAQFGERLQRTIDRIAFALEKERGSNRKPSDVRNDTALRFLGTSEGSLVTHLEFIRPPIVFGDFHDIATEAATAMVEGFNELRTYSDIDELPTGYDQGVLIVLEEFGKIVKSDINSIEFTVATPEQTYDAVFDAYTKEQIKSAISEPEEKIAAITGHLLMLNFGRERYQCHLYTDETNFIKCTFDEDAGDQIDTLIRHEVNAIGIATINPVTEEVDKFHIKQVRSLTDENPTPSELRADLDAFSKENDTLSSLRRGLEEALAGETHPISSLWDDWDDESE